MGLNSRSPRLRSLLIVAAVVSLVGLSTTGSAADSHDKASFVSPVAEEMTPIAGHAPAGGPAQPDEEWPQLLALQLMDGVVWIGLDAAASDDLVTRTIQSFPNAKVVRSALSREAYTHLQTLASSLGFGDGEGGYVFSYDFQADGILVVGNFNQDVADRVGANEPRLRFSYEEVGARRH